MLSILKADQRDICNVCSRLDSGVPNVSKPLPCKPRGETENKTSMHVSENIQMKEGQFLED